MSPCLPYGLYIWFYYNIFSLMICVCGLPNPLALTLSLPRFLVLVWIGNNSSYTFPFPLHTAYPIYSFNFIFLLVLVLFSRERGDLLPSNETSLHPASALACLLPLTSFLYSTPLASPPPWTPAVSYIRAHITILLLIQIETARLAWQLVYHNMFGTKLKILPFSDPLLYFT